ncbi:MAG: TonB-dependent receptor [Acidobacteriaceae bacterium]|nr:TonB-dependent receptor [Acidobacteriaceae bacterium]
MIFNFSRTGFFTLTIALAISTRLNAQTSTGEIDVTIQDPSGAVIPNATIAISGSETGNLVRTLVTNNAGLAEAPLLEPGNYDISMTAAGFEKLLRRGIVLRVGDVVNLRQTLTPGSIPQEVDVTGQTPLIEEKSATLGQVIEQREMIQFPLNGRNYLDLGRLAAGAVPSQGSRDQTFSAYGNTGLQNAFLLDGARNENYLRGLDNRARDMLRPPLDALSEFQVQTSNYSAEYGASAGAVVSAVTKGGTNQLHGSAYEFLRNDHLDASDFFAQPGVKPLLVQNQYGGSVGGPIVRDHAWIFGAYEGTHVRSESVAFATVPRPAMRQGNFGSTAIFDPLSTVPNPRGSGYVRTQFPGNVIPPQRFDQIAQQILNYYPLPNLSGVANNYTSNVPQLQANHNMVVRGDTQITTKDSIFTRASVTRFSIDANNPLPPPAQDPVDRTINSEGVGFGYTRAFSPTFVNEFRFSWTRMTINQDETTPLNPIISGLLDPQIKHGTPNFNITGFATVGAQPGVVGNSPLIKSSGVWDLSDNLSKSIGKHLLKFGTDLQAIRPSTFSALNGRGSLGFTGVFSQDPQNRSKSGSPVADLILGDANSLMTGTVAQAVERGRYGGWYVQDQWAVTSSLTLNLGVRYELFFPFLETHNRMANFILDPSDPLFGHLILSGDPAKPRGLITLDKNNWAPRVGFAWRVPALKSTVIRSSYGIFYAQDQGNGVTSRMTNNPPFYGYGGVSITSDQLNPATGFVLSSGALAPRPAPINPSQFVLNPASTTTLVSWNERYTTPYVQEWNFTVEKQLPGNMAWETSYVGNIGIHLWGQIDGNQPVVNAPGSPTTRRPLARYTVAQIKSFSPWNRTTYEGLSSRVEKRFSHGTSFIASFTYGRALDLQNPALDACDSCGPGDTVQNAYNRNVQKGPSDNNVPLRFALGGIWDLPFGPGRAFVSDGWLSQVVGSWQLSGIYQVQSGLPFTVNLSFDNANAGTTSYPNRVCNGNLTNPTISRWFDTSCFVASPSYQFGNEGRNVLTGPGRNNLDLGLHRVFRLPLRESSTLEIRAEAFNIFNHPQFGLPGATIGNPGVGVISSTAVANRELQLAARLAF